MIELNDDVKKELYRRLEKAVDKAMDDLVETIIREVVPNTGFGSRDGSALFTRASDIIATRFVTENYDRIVAKIDIDSIVRLASLRAVGKVSG